MITDEKINAAKKQLKSGKPAGEIKEELSAEGYSAEDIEKCFIVHKPDMRSWYLIFGIIFLLIGVWGAYYNHGILFFVFAAIMFLQYYLADKKMKAGE